MPALLVHGVPDTHRLWDRVRARLDRTDVVAVDLPGFGTPLPPGFEPTKEGYADWLVDQLVAHAIDGPVDLVGHDWGGNLAQRAASLRPDLVRSLACGGCPVDRDYTWHEMAQAWQAPGVGEEVMAATTPEALAAFLADAIDPEAAATAAAHLDDTMKQCILTLYRSAVTVGAEWQPGVDAVGGSFPALVMWGGDDPYVTPEFGARLARRLGAELVTLDGSGHWFPLTKPAETADALARLWAS
jgi:pimeloyl-ACP methyl ester carboxylesterase